MAPVTPKTKASATTTTTTKKKNTTKPSVGTRAWRLLRLAVLWARRGGAERSLRLLRTLRRHHGARGDRLRRGEREYSIEDTPAFRFRTPSARVLRLIPCIAPRAPDTPGLCRYGDDRYFFSATPRRGGRFEDDDDDGDGCGSCYGYGGGADDLAESVCDDDDEGDEDEEQLLERAMAEARRASTLTAAEGGEEEDAGVDVKAEEFIARFYAQMKLQRQVSWLQYNQMMQRSVS